MKIYRQVANLILNDIFKSLLFSDHSGAVSVVTDNIFLMSIPLSQNDEQTSSLYLPLLLCHVWVLGNIALLELCLSHSISQQLLKALSHLDDLANVCRFI